MKSGNLNFLEPSGPVQACTGTALPFTNIRVRLQIKKFLNVNFSHHPMLLCEFQIFFQALCLQTPALYVARETKFQIHIKRQIKLQYRVFRSSGLRQGYSILSLCLSPSSSSSIIFIQFLLPRRGLEKPQKSTPWWSWDDWMLCAPVHWHVVWLGLWLILLLLLLEMLSIFARQIYFVILCLNKAENSGSPRISHNISN